jgi:hypothetical protein
MFGIVSDIKLRSRASDGVTERAGRSLSSLTHPKAFVMSIQSVGTSALSYISATSLNTDTTSIDTVTDTDTGDDAAAQVSLSGPAEFLGKLQKLESSDPSQASDVLHQLASKLREQANGVSGDQATHLNAFADKLDKAADSGDLSGLAPSQCGARAHGHHHHHGGGGGGGDAEAVTPADSSDSNDNSSAISAYSKQASQVSDPRAAGKALFDTLNATLDSLTAVS